MCSDICFPHFLNDTVCSKQTTLYCPKAKRIYLSGVYFSLSVFNNFFSVFLIYFTGISNLFSSSGIRTKVSKIRFTVCAICAFYCTDFTNVFIDYAKTYPDYTNPKAIYTNRCADYINLCSVYTNHNLNVANRILWLKISSFLSEIRFKTVYNPCSVFIHPATLLF